jgi:DNA mismatch repair protein MutL
MIMPIENGLADSAENRIRQLPRQVYDLIAAGEVVTAPLSVVKELVENSVDAGASRIGVEIEEGGIAFLRVSDDGMGIAAEDLPLAFAPHATSKIDSPEDLGRIRTLGFRGEALASIAAVSKVTMITRARDAKTGTRMEIEGGETLSAQPVGAEPGTSVAASALFFNLPARLKHLNSARGEATKVIDYVSRMAVCYPQTAFRLTSNGTTLFATRGKGDRFAAVTTVYGTGVAATLVTVAAEENGRRLSGFVADPTGLRKTRRGQVLFVNGRSVKNLGIDAAIDRAYREFAEPGRFPVTFLFLEVAPSAIDVNVHPAKSEIAFRDSRAVGDFVENSIRNVLASERGIPKLRIPGWHRKEDELFRVAGTGKNEASDILTGSDSSETLLVSTSGGEGALVREVDIISLLSSDASSSARIMESAQDAYHATGSAPSSTPAANPIDARNEIHTLGAPNESPQKNLLCVSELRVLASLFATYLLAVGGDSFYVIDQHAAHERVNYEKFMQNSREGEVAKQELLTPYLFTAPAAAVADMEELRGLLARLGFEIDEFGENTYAARTFPAFVHYDEGVAFLGDVLADADDPRNPAAVERVIMRACKSSVKANDALTEPETEALLRDLAECGNPYTCPHGRPVFLKLTKSDIERMFKRA